MIGHTAVSTSIWVGAGRSQISSGGGLKFKCPAVLAGSSTATQTIETSPPLALLQVGRATNLIKCACLLQAVGRHGFTIISNMDASTVIVHPG
jgi:hypothetical protein